MLICSTFAYNRALYHFAERDPRLYVIICKQHHVKFWLKVASFCFEGTNTLIILDNCAASKDVKGRTGELVKLGFWVRHVSVWVLTLQLSSISFLTEPPLGLESPARFGFGLCPNPGKNLRPCSCEYGQIYMHANQNACVHTKNHMRGVFHEPWLNLYTNII